MFIVRNKSGTKGKNNCFLKLQVLLSKINYCQWFIAHLCRCFTMLISKVQEAFPATHHLVQEKKKSWVLLNGKRLF